MIVKMTKVRWNSWAANVFGDKNMGKERPLWMNPKQRRTDPDCLHERSPKGLCLQFGPMEGPHMFLKPIP